MTGKTLLILAFILLFINIVLPKVFGPAFGESVIVVLARPAGMTCFIIGMLRVRRERNDSDA